MSYLTLSSVVYADDLCYILFTEVELSCVGEVSIATPTQLNSTRRRVVDTFTASTTVNLSMNVVTQLTQFVGRGGIKKNTTDLAVRCSTESVELCHYKHPLNGCTLFN